MASYCILRSKSLLANVALELQPLFGQQVVRAMAVKASISTGKRKFRLPTNTEAQKLVNTVSGSNILKEGQDVPIKDDSEYPDWIWSLRLGKPLTSNEMEYGTKQYWEQLDFESKIRVKRMLKVKHKETMRVGEVQKKRMEWQDRIKYRALASYNHSAGWDPEQLKNEPDQKLWLKPQPDEEVLYPDRFTKENPRKLKELYGEEGVTPHTLVNWKMDKNFKY